jgi:hypothetical protein
MRKETRLRLEAAVIGLLMALSALSVLSAYLS